MTVALLIVDHGSRSIEANEMLHVVAAMLKRRRSDLIVKVAHMELADPTMKDAVIECVAEGATEIVVHPYMISPGRHASRDIPRLVQELARSHAGTRFKVTKPLGLHEKIIDVVLERANL